MKTPTLIRSIKARSWMKGHSAVIQIVSTGEALMERRLVQNCRPKSGTTSSVDITPREYRCSTTSRNSFPTQLYEAVHGFGRQPVVAAGLSPTASRSKAAKPSVAAMR
jgi:hypothetical protein